MKKNIIFIILISLAASLTTLYALDLKEIFFPAKINANLQTYYGSEYFPMDESYNYQQNTKIMLGQNLNLDEDVTVSYRLKYLHDFFNEKISLDSLKIQKFYKNFSISYAVYDKKIASISYLQNLDLSNNNYGLGLIENYRFTGLMMGYSGNDLSICSGIGGNALNRTLGFSDITWQKRDIKLKAGALYFARSNSNNQPGQLIYVEGNLAQKFLNLYTALSYEHFSTQASDPTIKRYNLYLESIFHITKNIDMGGGYFIMKEDCDWDRYDKNRFSIYGLAEIHFTKFSNIILTDYTETDTYIYRKYQDILSFNITDFWQLGIVASLINPDPGDESYQFGFQMVLNYE